MYWRSTRTVFQPALASARQSGLPPCPEPMMMASKRSRCVVLMRAPCGRNSPLNLRSPNGQAKLTGAVDETVDILKNDLAAPVNFSRWFGQEPSRAARAFALGPLLALAGSVPFANRPQHFDKRSVIGGDRNDEVVPRNALDVARRVKSHFRGKVFPVHVSVVRATRIPQYNRRLIAIGSAVEAQEIDARAVQAH